jgi:hypothetical protein
MLSVTGSVSDGKRILLDIGTRGNAVDRAAEEESTGLQWHLRSEAERDERPPARRLQHSEL